MIHVFVLGFERTNGGLLKLILMGVWYGFHASYFTLRWFAYTTIPGLQSYGTSGRTNDGTICLTLVVRAFSSSKQRVVWSRSTGTNPNAKFIILSGKLITGNRTEWSPLRSVIIRVITKSAGVRFVNHEYDYGPTSDDTKSHYQLMISITIYVLQFPRIIVKDVIWWFEFSPNFSLAQPTVRLQLSDYTQVSN